VNGSPKHTYDCFRGWDLGRSTYHMRSASIVFVFPVFASLPNLIRTANITWDVITIATLQLFQFHISCFFYETALLISRILAKHSTVTKPRITHPHHTRSCCLRFLRPRRVDLSLLLFSTINTTLPSPSCLNLSIHAASWWAPPTPTCQARETRASRLVTPA
jgi:hypothetical protein